MTAIDILKAIFALLAVLGVIGALAIVARRAGLANADSPLVAGLSTGAAKRRRLRLVETLHIDRLRRIAIVRADDREHLIAIDPNGVTLLERAMPRIAAPAEDLAAVSDYEPERPISRHPVAKDLANLLSTGGGRGAA